MHRLVSLFVAASLLGGAAVPAAAQSPTTPEDLLAGMVTEEVEPGVYRVISDGVRELARPIDLADGWEGGTSGDHYRDRAIAGSGVAANGDGVWLLRPEGLFGLGEADPLWTTEGWEEPRYFTVTSNGRLYQYARPTRLRVLQGGIWEPVTVPDRLGLRNIWMPVVGPDDTVWAYGLVNKPERDRRYRLVRRGPDGWSRVEWPGKRSHALGRLTAGPGGVLYHVRADGRVERFDGERWEALGQVQGFIHQLRVGPEGTVWLEVEDPDGSWEDRRLLRAEADGWVTHAAERQPPFDLARAIVGADGALWYPVAGDLTTEGGCGGVLRIDGRTTTRLLEGRCIYDMAVGPWGAVWAEAGRWVGDYSDPESVGPADLYVITPEAVAATE